MLLMILSLIFILISLIILLLSILLSKKNMLNSEKSSSYECGLQPISKQRKNFNMRFFQIAIIFLIFDAEICLLIPSPNSIYSTSSLNTIMIFIFIIIMSTLFEWKIGSLTWLK